MTLLSQQGELSKFLRKYLKETDISSNLPRKPESNEEILNNFNEYLYKKYNYESLNQSLFIPIKTNKIPEISINFANTMNSIIITEDCLDKNSLAPNSIKNNNFYNLTPNSAGILVKNNASCRSSMKNSTVKKEGSSVFLGKNTKSQQKIDYLQNSTHNLNNNNNNVTSHTNVSLSRCFTTNKCYFY